MIFSEEGFISVANLYKLGHRTQSIDFVEKDEIRRVSALQLTETIYMRLFQSVFIPLLCVVL